MLTVTFTAELKSVKFLSYLHYRLWGRDLSSLILSTKNRMIARTCLFCRFLTDAMIYMQLNTGVT